MSRANTLLGFSPVLLDRNVGIQLVDSVSKSRRRVWGTAVADLPRYGSYHKRKEKLDE